MMVDIKSELQSLGTSMQSVERSEQGRMLLGVLSKFATDFSNAIEGRSPQGSQGHSEKMLSDLYGGARISYIFNEIFGKAVKGIDHFRGLSDEDIRTAIRNATGPRPSLFVPEVSFETLVRRQISLLEGPGLQCVEMVYDELNRLISMCENAELFRFAELRDRVVDTVHLMLRQRLPPTQNMVTDLIKIEMSYINTNHPDFIGGSKAVAKLMERMQAEKQAAKKKKKNERRNNDEMKSSKISSSHSNSTSQVDDNVLEASVVSTTQRTYQDPLGLPIPPTMNAKTPNDEDLMSFLFEGKEQNDQNFRSGITRSKWEESKKSFHQKNNKKTKLRLSAPPKSIRQTGGASDKELIEMEIIKSLVASYFDVVRKNFMDLVPKTIMHHLVNHAKENIQSELVRNLYRDDIFDDVLRENDDVALRRKHSIEMAVLLGRALEIVNEVRDFNAFK